MKAAIINLYLCLICRITCWRVPTIAVVTRPRIWRPVTVGEGGVTLRCTTPQTLQVMAAPFKAVNHKRLHKKKIRCYLLFRKKTAVIMSFFFFKTNNYFYNIPVVNLKKLVKFYHVKNIQNCIVIHMYTYCRQIQQI